MKRLRAALALFAVSCIFNAGAVAASPNAGDTSTANILSFDGATGWLNSGPLRPEALRGKVVLVDFWEYTCINCLRTLPYLREWHRRYAKAGLVIVGVHTPEFGFSGDPKNVSMAIEHLNIGWPVALDTNRVIWDRYHNTIWPHEFLYDQQGRLAENVEGEGNYETTEAKIQSLLRAQNPAAHFPPVMALLPQDSYDKPGSVCYPHTPEIQLGASRGGAPANVSPFMDPGGANEYRDRASAYREGSIYLQGFWHAAPQAMISAGNDGYLALRYRAIEVVSVMKPETGGSMQVNLTQDGKPIPREAAGQDIRYDPRGNSYATVDAPRAYDLIMNKRYGQHDLRLLPQHYGLGVYSLDFESCEVGADR